MGRAYVVVSGASRNLVKRPKTPCFSGDRSTRNRIQGVHHAFAERARRRGVCSSRVLPCLGVDANDHALRAGGILSCNSLRATISSICSLPA